jgi:hypothetical protein
MTTSDARLRSPVQGLLLAHGTDALRLKGEERHMYLIREQLFRLREQAEITDESGQAVLQVDGRSSACITS